MVPPFAGTSCRQSLSRPRLRFSRSDRQISAGFQLANRNRFPAQGIMEAVLMRRVLIRILTGVGLFVMLTSAAAARPFEDGKAAYGRGEHVTAVQVWRPPAEQGGAAAQSNPGVMYVRRRGVPQDYAAEVKAYRRAAEQGNAKAQYNLGYMYANGRGVPAGRCQGCEVVAARRRARQRPSPGQSRLHVRQGPRRPAGLYRGGEVGSPRRRARRRPSPEQSRHRVRQRPRRPAERCRGGQVVSARRRAGRRGGPEQSRRHVRRAAEASRRTMPRRRSGIGSPPSKAMPKLNINSASCPTGA